MGFDPACKEQRTIRPLTRGEIEERLRRVAAEVGGWAAEPGLPAGETVPRWITCAELVRRVRPFIVYN